MINISHEEIDLFKNDWHLFADMVDFILGKNLGNGETRKVYQCGFDRAVVVKVESPHKEHGIVFDNVHEFTIWTNINKRMPEYAKYLAPCVRISGCGRLLIQKMTTPIAKNQLPKKIPYFLADTHINNWGMLNKRVVCHDYANTFIFTKLIRNKLIKPEWRFPA